MHSLLLTKLAGFMKFDAANSWRIFPCLYSTECTLASIGVQLSVRCPSDLIACMSACISCSELEASTRNNREVGYGSTARSHRGEPGFFRASSRRRRRVGSLHRSLCILISGAPGPQVAYESPSLPPCFILQGLLCTSRRVKCLQGRAKPLEFVHVFATL